MAQTGAEKGCCGNFALGVPGTASDPSLQCFADCCNTCPPDCCDTLYFYYSCCCEESEETELLPQFPIAAEDTDYYFPGDTLGGLPNFTLDDQPMVRALDAVPIGSVVGSCPCEELKITLTTSYCCFILGGGASATHVGDGSVSASVSGTSGYCGDYSAEISVNGGAWQSGPVAVADNDSVSVRLVVSGTQDCPEGCDSCECAFIRSEDPCNYSAEMFALQATPTGLRLVVNREAIMRRYNTLKQPQIINALRARKQTDPRTVRAVRRIAPVKSIKRVPIF